VTGADLKRRIIRIMMPGSADKLSFLRKLLLATIGIGAVAGPIIVGLMKAPLATAQSAQTNTHPQPRTVDGAEQPIGVTVQKIYHIGGDVSAPTLIFAPNPEFTEKARQAKYQGVCVISLIIDAQGKPKRVQVVRHLGMGLDKKAVEAVKQYTFTPAMRFGQPVAVEVNIEVNFRLS
jgi:TonB family protein